VLIAVSRNPDHVVQSPDQSQAARRHQAGDGQVKDRRLRERCSYVKAGLVLSGALEPGRRDDRRVFRTPGGWPPLRRQLLDRARVAERSERVAMARHTRAWPCNPRQCTCAHHRGIDAAYAASAGTSSGGQLAAVVLLAFLSLTATDRHGGWYYLGLLFVFFAATGAGSARSAPS
jgi:hypothetical protein